MGVMVANLITTVISKPPKNRNHKPTLPRITDYNDDSDDDSDSHDDCDVIIRDNSSEIVKSNFLSNYKPEGFPPRIILQSNTTSQDLNRFLTDFQRFIQGGKLFEDLAIPKMKVLGILGKYSDKDFF